MSLDSLRKIPWCTWDWEKEDLVQVPGGKTQHLNTWDSWNVEIYKRSARFSPFSELFQTHWHSGWSEDSVFWLTCLKISLNLLNSQHILGNFGSADQLLYRHFNVVHGSVWGSSTNKIPQHITSHWLSCVTCKLYLEGMLTMLCTPLRSPCRLSGCKARIKPQPVRFRNRDMF